MTRNVSRKVSDTSRDVTLTIDGAEVAVPAGTTILQACGGSFEGVIAIPSGLVEGVLHSVRRAG